MRALFARAESGFLGEKVPFRKQVVFVLNFFVGCAKGLKTDIFGLDWIGILRV